MLASGVSQYLHPEYLQPLPTTLDAKKSPLALLAQTCSSIGKDPTPSKPIIPPIDKKEKEAADKLEQEKRPSSRGSKGSSGESGRDSSSKPGFRTIPPKDIPPLVPIGGEKASSDNNSSSSNSHGPSSNSKSSSSSSENTTTSHSHSLPTVSSSSFSSSSHNSVLSSSSSSSSSRDNARPVSATGSSSQRSSSRSGSARDAASDFNHNSSPAASHSLTRHSASASPTPMAKSSSAPVSQGSSSLSFAPKPSVSHPSLIHGGFPPAHPLAAAYPHLSMLPGLDPAMQSYHNALVAHSGLSSLSMAAAAAAAQSSAAALKGASSAALSPYVAYARVRTPSGATTLVPVCRDPYCTNCQLTLQNSHLSSACTAPGCSQCAHEKSLTSLTSGALAGLGGASLPILSSMNMSSAGSLSSGMAGLSSLHSSLYPLAAHQGLGYVCSWVAAGSEYCGKRFANSEELLQHLRTHTSSAVEASSFAAYGALGLHPSLAAAAAAGCHSHYPGSPLSPNSLRRAYPTSLSPVSSLLSANRYHPYKSLGAVPPPAPSSAQGLPAVGPYYSHYSLYGQRLGAAAVP